MSIRFFSALLLIVISGFNVVAQSFADKSFYLIDSLDLSSLSKEDRVLIDTTLELYHTTQQDTTKLALIEFIVDECWNDNVWPKYNDFVYKQSLLKLNTSHQVSEHLKYTSFIAGAISNRGYQCDNQGDVPRALTYYHQSLKLYETIGDKSGTATGLNNLGVLYSSQNDTTKAFYYHNESLKIKKQINDKRGISLSLNNIGTIYENRGFVFEALKCYKQSLKICREIGDLRGIAISYDNIGGVYFSEGYPTKAIDYYNMSLYIWEALGDLSGVAFSNNNLAEVYLKMGKLNQAKKHAKLSLETAEKIGYTIDIQNAAFTLFQINKKQNDFKNALNYYELHVSMRDSVFNENTERISKIQGMKYQYEKEALQDSLENAQIQALKDSQISEQTAIISKEKILKYALLTGMILMGWLVFISVRGYRRKQKDNELIQKQKSEVENQKVKIEKQHQILEETFKEISDSITYAKRIQQAILPPRENFVNYFKDCFVWYRPKNVVSGDFYWLDFVSVQKPSGERDDIVLFAVADCTGHGVPGAMVSVVCHNSLNRSVLEFGLVKPDEILNKTRELVIETFDKSEDDVKDGMDIALCSINLKTHELIYAGANNNLYLIRNNNLIEIKADKQPIGRFAILKPFSSNTIQLQKNDCIYLFSDGLADQFGGPKGKKFKYQQFKEILLNNCSNDMIYQQTQLDERFEKWKGELEQVDDICVIGVGF